MTLQRVRPGLPGHEDVTPEQREASRKRLEQFVDTLATNLNPPQDGNTEEALRLPGTLVARIRSASSGPLPRFLTELGALRDHLTNDDRALSDTDVALLEGLTNSVNQETSRVFNRLWRR
jgi:hypothetical protein